MYDLDYMFEPGSAASNYCLDIHNFAIVDLKVTEYNCNEVSGR